MCVTGCSPISKGDLKTYSKRARGCGLTIDVSEQAALYIYLPANDVGVYISMNFDPQTSRLAG